jgi:hypothetical protein
VRHSRRLSLAEGAGALTSQPLVSPVKYFTAEQRESTRYRQAVAEYQKSEVRDQNWTPLRMKHSAYTVPRVVAAPHSTRSRVSALTEDIACLTAR